MTVLHHCQRCNALTAAAGECDTCRAIVQRRRKVCVSCRDVTNDDNPLELDGACRHCHTLDDERRQDQIAALLTERSYYEQQGRTNRIPAVDAELAHLGHEQEPTA
jgi:hypothetical protein